MARLPNKSFVSRRCSRCSSNLFDHLGWVRGCDFSGCDLPGKNALKAYKSPSIRRPAGPSSVFHLVSPVANGTIILPTRQVLMNAPSILRRPCHLAADGLGPVPGGCGVLQVVKTAQSRGRTERTLFLQHFRNYCGAIKVGQALMISRRLAADARAERAGARPSRAVVARRR